MKYILLILLSVFSFATNAQQLKPVGVANTYTLTEADGFPGSNYVTQFQIAPSGKIYIKDFFGNFHITGNNFIKQVNGLNNVVNEALLHLQPNGDLWLTHGTTSITIIKNDTLQKKIRFSMDSTLGENYQFYKYKFRPTGNYIEVYKFITDKWILVNKAKWDETIKLNSEKLFVNKNGKLFIVSILPNASLGMYAFDTVLYQFKFINTVVPFKNVFQDILYNDKWKINTNLVQSFANFCTNRLGRPIQVSAFKAQEIYTNFVNISYSYSFVNYQNGLYEYFTYDSTHILTPSFLFETKNKINGIQNNPYYPYYTALTSNKPFRVFPYIKKYPNLFNKNSSANIFSVVEDDNGSIWAGSYEHYLTVLSPSLDKYTANMRLKELGKQPYAFMNAGINFNHKLYFVGETNWGGVLQYSMDGKMHKLNPQTPVGFYLYYAPRSKTIWMPSAAGFNQPIYTCKANELEKPTIHWEKLDSTVGIKKIGFSTMTEDTLQRIWIGHPKKGFAVYNQQTKKAITYDLHNNETPIGFISCITDSKGTIFMGSDDKGLWYYNDYSKPPTPQNIHNLYHPLLNGTVRITAMTIYKNWLILSCYNKMCLLNLDSFYMSHKVIVRYLNPQESAFTSTTEQNTLLVSKKDSSIWLSTSDMLYQWDIKTWLQLPIYKVNLQTFLQRDSSRTELNANSTLQLQAGINSFDIVFEYLSPDCLPRYTRTALVKSGEKFRFTEPNLQSTFSYKNLNSGKYFFYIDIFEQDGSTSHYMYSFVINKFIWQQWWFWVLLSCVFLVPIILWLNILRKQAIQQKQISQLNVVTLSNQFRPHFILNALNTIGADLKDKPAAETVISRLGESINLIFNHAQQKTITHGFKNEWHLVENIIQIHRVMYLPNLQVGYPDNDWMLQNMGLQLPMGILEIFVENALLHGLRNRKNSPYILTITAKDDEINNCFTISDNGIGRSNAINLSNHKGHGMATKNITEILAILNKYNKNGIEIIYQDNIYSGTENVGTSVTIIIPKNYHYEY
jgi:hypothetical protein